MADVPADYDAPPAPAPKGLNPLNLSGNPRARQILYAIAFVAAALSLFAPLVPGDLGHTLASALGNLSALATASATATALSNMSPAPNAARSDPKS